MNDPAKSALLARAMEWDRKTHEVVKGGWLFRPSMSDRWISNLYDPANMHLVWQVLNWAAKREDDLDDYAYPYYFAQNIEWLFDTGEAIEDQLWAKPLAEAQRILLDQILETCIEAGIIEVGDE